MIKYFAQRHLLANVLFFGVILIGAFSWYHIGKEEMPEFESNWVRVNTIYPGASAEDVELFVTKPMEDELKGVVGIDELATTSSLGVSSLRITIDDDYPDKDEVVQDIQDAILRARLPSEVRDLPRIRQFKSSEKAILDIGMYHKDQTNLDAKGRAELQAFVLGFENQLLARKEVSSISRSHYRKPELQILVDPAKILAKEISLSQVKNQIQANNIRTPVGSLEDVGESKVTALNELEDVDSLKALILRGNYEGQGISLSEIANIQDGFERSTSIFKVNGHEGIFLNVKKSISTDILSAQKVVSEFIKKFKEINKEAPIGIVLMDDESYAVTNRLNIISSNGILGFVLIILVLFIFLDIKAGFWVAMGIPFCMALTLIIANLYGYTVNNMTLAGIIIVLGIVVDDAIIIAENISRHKESGLPIAKAAIVGAREVVKPISASIITTCIAFLPLFFFEGFFGKLVKYIPLIVILMLVASLIESLLILPSHLSSKNFILDRLSSKKTGAHWFYKFEERYERFLTLIFKLRVPIMLVLLIGLSAGFYFFQAKMKFVMFPREESKEVFIKVKAPKESSRLETSKLIEPLENYLAKDTANVVGVRSSIALSRRGGAVKENEASILVELYPADERKTPLNKLLKDWEAFGDKVKGLDSVKFQRGRWGHGSGNAIEIQIQENNDQNRMKIAEGLKKEMEAMLVLTDIEIDEPLTKKEYLLNLNQKNMIRFDVSPAAITTVLRSFVEGSILYSINKGDEEVDVRLTMPEGSKTSLDDLLKMRVENKAGQLVYLNKVVSIKEMTKPTNITRNNFKRATMVYANLVAKTKKTPLEIADLLETEVFPRLNSQFPSSVLTFKGEIEDSRESQGEFRNSILIVLLMIYLVLVIMFNSVTKPLLVLAVVPFGGAGVIFSLMAHGMSIYGFFALIGTLGMIGVVINDAIVMIDKIDRNLDKSTEDPWKVIANVSSTRLRPVLLTTITTVVGVLPTAYGLAGYDSMLAEMMLAMGWGLVFGMFVTLIVIPLLYTFIFNRKFA